MASHNRTGSPSLWYDTIAVDSPPQRAPLKTDDKADVAIVGAGYTGLWTAYYLLKKNPHRRVVVLEAEHAGFGASGRNGGWCSALFPRGLKLLSAMPGSNRNKALALHNALRNTIDVVGQECAEAGIDAHFYKGGSIYLARSPVQWQRLQAEVAAARSWGRTPDELRLVERAEAAELLNATDLFGAAVTPDCARIQPALLVRGLAEAVERLGGQIYEHSPVVSIRPGQALGTHGTVRAPVVIRATEGYTPGLADYAREVVPVYSLIVATEPLPAQTWDSIGLAQRQTFNDARHLIIYGQRTADDRLVFGGRGAPYHFGSEVSPSFDLNEAVFAKLRQTLMQMFPVLTEANFTHSWGGPLGIPRDWCASVGLDQQTGIGWAGGYVGDGVATSNLAGRTLCDLIDGTNSALVELPWVNHRSPQWEPEPLRWAMINSGLHTMNLADWEERVTSRPSLAARVMAPFIGGH